LSSSIIDILEDVFLLQATVQHLKPRRGRPEAKPWGAEPLCHILCSRRLSLPHLPAEVLLVRVYYEHTNRGNRGHSLKFIAGHVIPQK
jgi:hypothetical protein